MTISFTKRKNRVLSWKGGSCCWIWTYVLICSFFFFFPPFFLHFLLCFFSSCSLEFIAYFDVDKIFKLLVGEVLRSKEFDEQSIFLLFSLFLTTIDRIDSSTIIPVLRRVYSRSSLSLKESSEWVILRQFPLFFSTIARIMSTSFSSTVIPVHRRAYAMCLLSSSFSKCLTFIALSFPFIVFLGIIRDLL